MTIFYVSAEKKELKELSQSLSEILAETMQKILDVIPKVKLKQHANNLPNEYHIGKHRLSLLRTGLCPETCFVSLNVTTFNELTQRESTDYTFQGNRTFVMNPVVINFNHAITGFVLKIWHWPPHPFPDVSFLIWFIYESYSKSNCCFVWLFKKKNPIR